MIYLAVFNTNLITNIINHTCKNNEFINFKNFHTIIIEDLDLIWTMIYIIEIISIKNYI